MTGIETEETRRTAGRVSRRSSGPAYWLISKTDHNRVEVLTLDHGGREILPVFSYEEEAEMFLRFGDLAGRWRVRESAAGELLSVLYGLCSGVKEVALDPLPEMVAERTVGLVSLLRGRFIEHVLDRRPPWLCEPAWISEPEWPVRWEG